jgi:Na+-translocating ferredoxin:NAD+ oxidoreductase RnfD subunit
MGAKIWQLLKTAKVQMSISLFLIALTAIINSHSYLSILTLLLALATALISDLIFVKLRKVETFFPSAAIVSGLIIGLLTYFQLPWYQVVTTGIIAMISKNFLRLNDRHIFNPAGFGLFITTLIFHQSVSWWGVSLQSLSLNIVSIFLFLIVISPGFVSMIRLKRYFIPISFFCTYIFFVSLLRFLQHNFNLITILQVTLLSSIILFFSLVMLPEPMTSPNKPKWQIIYGAFVGMLATLLSLYFPNYFPDIFIGALLIGNALAFKFK